MRFPSLRSALILYALYNITAAGGPSHQGHIIDEINAYLEEHPELMDAHPTAVIDNQQAFKRAVMPLIEAELVDLEKPRSPYYLTPFGNTLGQLMGDDWRKWNFEPGYVILYNESAK